MALDVAGERVVYFLCAPIADDDWLVHRGSYRETGELDDMEPFHEKDLIVKNIVRDAWGQKPNQRLRTSSEMNTMRGLVQAADCTWRRCLAIAAYIAEEIRSSSGTFDSNVAKSGFERNPFRWVVDEGRRSQAGVTFLWSWHKSHLPGLWCVPW